ncbi:MAG: hypothetical protein U0836_13695 [Pirellulales bacterium]
MSRPFSDFLPGFLATVGVVAIVVVAFVVGMPRRNVYLAIGMWFWALLLVLVPPKHLQDFTTGFLTCLFVAWYYAAWERKPPEQPVPLPRLPKAE